MVGEPRIVLIRFAKRIFCYFESEFEEDRVQTGIEIEARLPKWSAAWHGVNLCEVPVFVPLILSRGGLESDER